MAIKATTCTEQRKLGALRRVGAGLMASLWLTAACSAAVESDGTVETEAVQTLGEELGANWRNEFRAISANANGLKFSPAACAAQHSGYEVISTDSSTSRYRMWIYESALEFMPTWVQLGTETFASKPTCAALRGLDAGMHSGGGDQLVILGKKSNNRYAAAVWQVAPPPPPPGAVPAPTQILGWTELNTQQYDSAPAAAVANGYLVVVGRRTDNRLYLQRNPLVGGLTYNNSNWLAAVQLPALPSPWIARGNPALAPLMPSLDMYAVTVRAENSTTHEMAIYYYSWVPWAASNWARVPVGAEGVASDPAVEFTREDGGNGEIEVSTVYYRALDNGLYHSAGLGSFAGPPARVMSNTFVEDPAAVGNLTLESHHVLISRQHTGGRYYFIAGVFGEW